MPARSVRQVVKALEVTEGGGVTVHRTIGTPSLRNLDPFLMLDHFSSDDPDDYIAGFPDHPHRGFITFTYMLDGHMLHRDSMGNEGDLLPGAAQWMKAASGVIHSEMPQQTAGLMRGFQLWINLPISEKMSAPAYQEFPPDAFPLIEEKGRRIKVLIGSYEGQSGPVRDPHTHVQYLDVYLEAQHNIEVPVDPQAQGFVCVFEGDATLADTALPRHTLAVLDAGDSVEIVAGDNDVRFILVAGHPIGEPVVQYGPFVMDSREGIERAMADYRDGTLVREKASFTDPQGSRARRP